MSNRAWVTLATNDSYGLGALVLAHSLRRVGSSHPAVVLITPSVTDAMRERLRAVFADVVTVDVLDSRDAAHLALLQRPELGITFTKIHCWSLTQYEKCVFLDADTLIIQNCDELFEREELSAAPDVGWPDCFNSGVFVYKPSNETFEKLIKFAQERGSFDGGDQGLLNSFFSDWAHGDINKHLPFLYNVTSAAFYSYLPALKHYGQNLKIIHFIGIAKPWLQQFNWESRTVEAPEHLRGLLQLWWDLFVGQVHPQLDVSMSGVAGNLARVVPGALGSQREALDELTRRQGWEAGNIDYMGADSFDNIWAKISQTLSQPRASPPKQPSPPREEVPAPVEVAQEAASVDAAPAPAPVVETPVEPKAAGEAPVAAAAPAAAAQAPAVEAAPAPQAAPKEEAKQAQPEPVAAAEIPATVEAAAAAPAPDAPKPEAAPVEPSDIPATVEAIAPGEAPQPADVPASVETAASPEVVKEEPKTETPALPPTPPVTPKSTPEATPVSESAPTLEVEVQKEEAPAPVEASAIPAPVEAPVVPTPVAAAEVTPVVASETPAPAEASKDPEPTVEAKKEEIPVPAEAASAPEVVETQKEAPVEAPKETAPAAAAPASPAPGPQAPVPKPDSTPEKSSEAPSLSASTDSPPLANTPSKEEAPALPAAKSEERRKAVGKLQLSPPAAADPLPTPDSELEDAAALAQSIIASELRSDRPKAKPTTASQIESSVSDKSEPTPPTDAPKDAPKKKIVKKVKKESAAAGGAEAPVPPPRKKEKKPKEK